MLPVRWQLFRPGRRRLRDSGNDTSKIGQPPWVTAASLLAFWRQSARISSLPDRAHQSVDSTILTVNCGLRVKRGWSSARFMQLSISDSSALSHGLCPWSLCRRRFERNICNFSCRIDSENGRAIHNADQMPATTNSFYTICSTPDFPAHTRFSEHVAEWCVRRCNKGRWSTLHPRGTTLACVT